MEHLFYIFFKFLFIRKKKKKPIIITALANSFEKSIPSEILPLATQKKIAPFVLFVHFYLKSLIVVLISC